MSKRDFNLQLKETDRPNNINGHKATVTKQNQGKEIATDLYYGGMIRDEIGGFHPEIFFSGLLKRAEEAGVIVSDLPVLEIENEKKGKIVITLKVKFLLEKLLLPQTLTSNKI